MTALNLQFRTLLNSLAHQSEQGLQLYPSGQRPCCLSCGDLSEPDIAIGVGLEGWLQAFVFKLRMVIIDEHSVIPLPRNIYRLLSEWKDSLYSKARFSTVVYNHTPPIEGNLFTTDANLETCATSLRSNYYT